MAVQVLWTQYGQSAVDITDQVDFSSMSLEQNASGINALCRFDTFTLLPFNTEFQHIYRDYGIRDLIRIREDTLGGDAQWLFSGFVTSITPEQNGDNIVQKLEIADYTSIFDVILVDDLTITNNSNDKSVIEQIFAHVDGITSTAVWSMCGLAHQPTATDYNYIKSDAAYLFSDPNTLVLRYQGVTVKAALEAITNKTGYTYWVDEALNFHYGHNTLRDIMVNGSALSDTASWSSAPAGTSLTRQTSGGPYNSGTYLRFQVTGTPTGAQEVTVSCPVTNVGATTYMATFRYRTSTSNNAMAGQSVIARWYNVSNTLLKTTTVALGKAQADWATSWFLTTSSSGTPTSIKISLSIGGASASSSRTEVLDVTDIRVVPVDTSFGFLETGAVVANHGDADAFTWNDFENGSTNIDGANAKNVLRIFGGWTDPATHALYNEYEHSRGIWALHGRKVYGAIYEAAVTDDIGAAYRAAGTFEKEGIPLRTVEFDHQQDSDTLRAGKVVPFIWETFGIAEPMIVRTNSAQRQGTRFFWKSQLGGDPTLTQTRIYALNVAVQSLEGLVNDATAPAVPANLTIAADAAVLDSNGNATSLITATWDRNKEPDLSAYKVQFSEAATSAIANAFASPIESTLSRNQNLVASITGASGNGTYVTYTTAANHNFTAGDLVSITGAIPVIYNLREVQVYSGTGTSFAVQNSATGTYASGGVASSVPSRVKATYVATSGKYVAARVSTTDFMSNASSPAATSPIQALLDTTPPDSPTSLYAVSTIASIMVSWSFAETTDTNKDWSRYELQRVSAAIAEFPGWTDATLKTYVYYDKSVSQPVTSLGETEGDENSQYGRFYWYRVRVVDKSENKSAYAYIGGVSTPTAAQAVIAGKVNSVDIDSINAKTITSGQLSLTPLGNTSGPYDITNIEPATPGAGFVRYTTLQAHGFTTSTKVQVIGSDPINYDLPRHYPITAVLGSGTAITFTSTAHGITAGQIIDTTGLPFGFNLASATVVTPVTANQFTVTSTVSGSYATSGTASIQPTWATIYSVPSAYTFVVASTQTGTFVSGESVTGRNDTNAITSTNFSVDNAGSVIASDITLRNSSSSTVSDGVVGLVNLRPKQVSVGGAVTNVGGAAVNVIAEDSGTTSDIYYIKTFAYTINTSTSSSANYGSKANGATVTITFLTTHDIGVGQYVNFNGTAITGTGWNDMNAQNEALRVTAVGNSGGASTTSYDQIQVKFTSASTTTVPATVWTTVNNNATTPLARIYAYPTLTLVAPGGVFVAQSGSAPGVLGSGSLVLGSAFSGLGAGSYAIPNDGELAFITTASPKYIGGGNLYQSATDTLRTSGQFAAGGNITSSGSLNGNLVNTLGTTSGGIRFGSEYLYFDSVDSRFEFSDDVYATGSIQSGTSITSGTTIYAGTSGTGNVYADFLNMGDGPGTTNTTSVRGIMLYGSNTTGYAVISNYGTAQSDATALYLKTDDWSASVDWYPIRFSRMLGSGLPYANTGVVRTYASSTTVPTFLGGSDYRMKANIRNARSEIDMLGVINRLRPVLFDNVIDPESPQKYNQLGYIAHEVQAVVPLAVSGEKDAVDGDGNPVYQMMSDSKFLPYIVGALQQISERLDALEGR